MGIFPKKGGKIYEATTRICSKTREISPFDMSTSNIMSSEFCSQDGSYCTQGTRHLSNHFTNTFPPFTIFASAPPGYRSNRLRQSLAAHGATWYQFIPWDSESLLKPALTKIDVKLGGNLDGRLLEISPVAHWCEIFLRDNEESAQVPGHIRILPKDGEHMLMNKILKLHMMMWRRAGSIEYDPEWLWHNWLPKKPTTISIPLFRKQRVFLGFFSYKLQAQAPHFLLGDSGLTAPAAVRARLGR